MVGIGNKMINEKVSFEKYCRCNNAKYVVFNYYSGGFSPALQFSVKSAKKIDSSEIALKDDINEITLSVEDANDAINSLDSKIAYVDEHQILSTDILTEKCLIQTTG